MTTGEQTIHLVSGKTITYTLDLNERIAEAMGEVPEKPTLTDVMAFGVAAFQCLAKCDEFKAGSRNKAIEALRAALDDASLQNDGSRFF